MKRESCTVLPSWGENPFATRHVRPGTADYLFPAGYSQQQLLRRLQQHDWWGVLQGPHGSGKSTLLRQLLPELAACGRQVHVLLLCGGRRAAPIAPRSWTSGTQVVVDGFDRLSWWRRLGLIAACRRRRSGLLVTAHRPSRLPLLVEMRVSLELAQEMVRRRWPNPPLDLPQHVEQAFRLHRGNMREVLFTMYDLYERCGGSAGGMTEKSPEGWCEESLRRRVGGRS